MPPKATKSNGERFLPANVTSLGNAWFFRYKIYYLHLSTSLLYGIFIKSIVPRHKNNSQVIKLQAQQDNLLYYSEVLLGLDRT